MLDVISIGTATRDVFLRSPLFKIVRDPKHLERLGFPNGEAQCFALGGKIEVEGLVQAVGGGAANAAVTFARQGLKTALFAKIGDDQNGELVLDDLKQEKIGSLLVRDKKIGTAYSVVLLSHLGERTILNYRGASEDLKKNEVPFSKLRARWAYIAPGRIPVSVMNSIIKKLEKNKVRIAMNPSRYYLSMGSQKLRSILNALDVVIMNREEAAALTGISYHEERNIFKKMDELIKGIAVMTDGANGVLVSDGSRAYRARTFAEKKLVDRTGSGDAFGSGFVSALAAHNNPEFDEKSIQHAIRLGSANATSVVEHIGAQKGILRKEEFTRAPRFRHLIIRERTVL